MKITMVKKMVMMPRMKSLEAMMDAGPSLR
jgi:hypothetical protein